MQIFTSSDFKGVPYHKDFQGPLMHTLMTFLFLMRRLQN